MHKKKLLIMHWSTGHMERVEGMVVVSESGVWNRTSLSVWKQVGLPMVWIIMKEKMHLQLFHLLLWQMLLS
jgi:hypothetical protein